MSHSRCVVLAIASCILSATARPLGMRFGMDNYHPHQLSATDSAPASYVDQAKDHFSTQSGSWKQAYYVNDTYFTPGSNAPIFLCVGGEGPALDATAVSGSVHCNIAVEWLAETKALMLAVEHRYYGNMTGTIDHSLLTLSVYFCSALATIHTAVAAIYSSPYTALTRLNLCFYTGIGTTVEHERM